MFATDETIAAIASPPGAAYRGIVRISGPATLEVVKSVFRSDQSIPSRPERVEGMFDLGVPLGEVDASVLVWPTDRSYTGMPSAEVHLPGAQPILNAGLQQILDSGARLAQPGEFTLRAFLAGRLDLTEAEAVLGVIDAEDQRSLDAALKQLSGGLSGPLHALRTELLNLLAHLEAGLDFVEEDIEFITQQDLLANVQEIWNSVNQIVQQMQFRDHSSTVPMVVFRGEPNAGKSSLINAISESQVAIVSSTSGTTRDWVETSITLGGMDVRLIDTAGIEAEQSGIESQAQGLGNDVESEADLVLICVDLGQSELTQWQREIAGDARHIFIGTKSDAPTRLRGDTIAGWHVTSSQSGFGVKELRSLIGEHLQSMASAETATVASTAVRCRETLVEAVEALERAQQIVVNHLGEELVAAELRGALNAIGRVTGEVYTDDILDRIFSEFCIGK